MSDDEITALINFLAKNPEAGDEIVGTGGCRKLRFALKSNNKGKSGGARIVTFYSGVNMPVFLIAAFKKGDKINLTKAERNKLKAVTDEIAKSYAKRVTRLKVGATV